MDSLILVRNGHDKLFQSLMPIIGFFDIALALLLAANWPDFSHHPWELALVGSNRLDPSKWQNVLVFLNGLSFFSAVCGLLVSVGCSFSLLTFTIPHCFLSVEKEIAIQQKRLAIALHKLLHVFIFSLLSITCHVIEYVFLRLTIARDTRSGQLLIIIAFVIGSFICAKSFLRSVRDVFELWRGICDFHAEQWLVLNRETFFGRALIKYVEFLYKLDSTASCSGDEGRATSSTDQKHVEGCCLKGIGLQLQEEGSQSRLPPLIESGRALNENSAAVLDGFRRL